MTSAALSINQHHLFYKDSIFQLYTGSSCRLHLNNASKELQAPHNP